MFESGLDSSFTQKELNALGIKIPEVIITSVQIKKIRKKRHLSQTVFAQLLNVSPSSVRQIKGRGLFDPCHGEPTNHERLFTTFLLCS